MRSLKDGCHELNYQVFFNVLEPIREVMVNYVFAVK